MSCKCPRWPSPASGPRRPTAPRAAMALVLVLVVLTLGLGLSFALLQAQSVQMFLQRNASHRDQARQAALSGVSAALRQIRQRDWAGVDTSFERSLGNGRSFRVSYTAGDASLQPTDADYWLWPYRVTITVTGRSEGPLNPQQSVEYTIELVVQLVPEKLQPVPSAWSESLSYSLFQRSGSGNGNLKVEVPCQVQGAVRLQETLKYMQKYPEPQQAAQRLAQDWNALRQQGGKDHRTFTGSMELPWNKQGSDTLTLLQKLGISLSDRATDPAEDWSLAQSITSYRLYPGGPQFQAQAVSSYLQDTVLEADPKTNPLGLFYRNGSIELGDHVQVRGTLLTYTSGNGTLYLSGHNITIEPVSMPPLAGQTLPVQLPALVLLQHLKVQPGASAEIRGAVYVADRLRVTRDSQSGISFLVQGPVSLRRLNIRPRSQWDRDDDWWEDRWDEFQQSGHPWFPLWLAEQHGLDSTPRIVLSGPLQTVHYHWPDGTSPFFDYPAPDQGLHWDLVRWEESGS